MLQRRLFILYTIIGKIVYLNTHPMLIDKTILNQKEKTLLVNEKIHKARIIEI